MGNQIEIGCMVVCVGAYLYVDRIGQVGTVIGINDGNEYTDGAQFSVEFPTPDPWDGERVIHFHPYHLSRIDGDPDSVNRHAEESFSP